MLCTVSFTQDQLLLAGTNVGSQAHMIRNIGIIDTSVHFDSNKILVLYVSGTLHGFVLK